MKLLMLFEGVIGGGVRRSLNTSLAKTPVASPGGVNTPLRRGRFFVLGLSCASVQLFAIGCTLAVGFWIVSGLHRRFRVAPME